MKISALLITLALLLVACGGGGDESPVARIQTSVPRPVANAATVSGGSGVTVHMYQALYGQAPSNALLLAYTAQATADSSAFARDLSSTFTNTSHAALAKLVLDNLGVTATTVTAAGAYVVLLDAVQQLFSAYPTMRGQVILNMTDLLAGLEADGTYGVAAAAYNIKASANYAYASNAANTVPAVVSTSTANAGPAQSVVAGALVTLDGSSSTADMGRTLTYVWMLTSKPAGSAATLSSSTSAKPTFTADVAGTYVASLTVNDGKVNSTIATVTITAVANVAPVANAGVAQNVTTGTLVTLNGTASSDANGVPLTYAWTLTAKPSGSNATLTNTTSSRPTFIADVAGSYSASLVVNDGRLSSIGVAVTITATYSTISYLPSLSTTGIASARPLSFVPYTPPVSNYVLPNNWSFAATFSTSAQYAVLSEIFSWSGVAGVTYDITSSSYFDPFVMEIFDSQGKVIEAVTGSSGSAMKRGFVAPYTGTYYLNAGWNQGAYYTFVSIGVYQRIQP